MSAEGQVVATVPRDALWFAQTPQVFRYELLLQAHLQYIEAATDDATMLESMGHPVKVFRGSPENLKVTTPEDLDIAGAFLRAPGGSPSSASNMNQNHPAPYHDA